MKKNKRNFKRSLQVLISTLFIIPALISCVMPEDSTKDNSESKKAELEAKRLQKKMEIYNKMLGNWESSESGRVISTYHTITYTEEDSEVLHIQPTKWYWSKEKQDDAVCKTWDKPFYNYIYLYEEWSDDNFFEKNNIDKYRNGYYKNIWNQYDKDSVIYININDFGGKNRNGYLFHIDELPTKLTANGHVMKRSTINGNDDDDQGGDTGGSTGGENIDLSGFWNYEVPGQSNAGGIVTFGSDGKLVFNQKVTSYVREAKYTISGNVMKVQWDFGGQRVEEDFRITKNNNVITIKYDGNNQISQILQIYFGASQKEITLTKN